MFILCCIQEFWLYLTEKIWISTSPSSWKLNHKIHFNFIIFQKSLCSIFENAYQCLWTLKENYIIPSKFRVYLFYFSSRNFFIPMLASFCLVYFLICSIFWSVLICIDKDYPSPHFLFSKSIFSSVCSLPPFFLI